MPLKVLICDDAAFMRNMIKNILIGDGHQVVGEAINGVESIQKYKELKPDVVTMDIVMPEKDGIDAVREIIKFDPDARIIMCSALGQQAMVIDAIQAGAKDYIVKPFRPQKVIETVKKVIRQ
jgi:two-component system, chemotaxis family, chemotaxis protein CheY